MKKKIILITVIVLAVIIIGAIGLFKHIESNLESLADIKIPEINMAEIEDGDYNGSYSAFPVAVEVSVTVRDHEIIGIEILKHMNGQGTPAEVITDKVIESQSLQVDTVTGATYSSMVILCSIKNSLLGTE